MSADFDLAILGSGFAGSLLAMIARRLGRKVLLLERGRHPRFVIGESSTPLANLLLEELATRYALPRLLPLTKWGSWQRHYPQLAGGLKRGFTFYHHHAGSAWQTQPDRGNELLVAASPRDEIGDTHWYRPQFDQFLASEAQVEGAEFFDEFSLDRVDFEPGRVTLSGRKGSRDLRFRARFIVDATGPRGALHRLLGLKEATFPGLPRTHGLYGHFTGVHRWADLHPAAEAPPYPPDDAALHHVFDGGWMWVLRFNNGITSAGFSLAESIARDVGLPDAGGAWRKLMRRFPSMGAQFAEAAPIGALIQGSPIWFRSARVVGPNWALLPSAAGVVDPLLSTGFPLTLLGVERLARWLEDGSNPAALAGYESTTLAELDLTARLVAALYRNLNRFEVFTALTMLYFAAASFSEAARRLGRSELAAGFLLRERPNVVATVNALVDASAAPDLDPVAFARTVHRAIEPFNVAGLGDAAKRNWYPASAADLLAATAKLGASHDEIAEMLERVGFKD